MQEIYQDIVNYINSVAKNPFEILPVATGFLASFYLYTLAMQKGLNDMFGGRDTFSSRAHIPSWNKSCKIAGENQITNEAEFQNLLRHYRGEISDSQLENTVQGGNQ